MNCKLLTRLLVLSAPLLLAGIVYCAGKKESVPGYTSELVVCGWDEVFILGLSGPTDSTVTKIWSWRAADSQILPDSMKTRFASTDECKPVDGGKALLITSSSDGVAIVERATREVKFWASAVNAHSAELLPGGLVAVAASHRPDQPGDRLILFSQGTPGRELAHYELIWGHGVVWDSERELLYALADDHVRIFTVMPGKADGARLQDAGRIDLPEGGGHDFFPVPSSSYLSISTGKHCWLLDRESGEVLPHPDIHEHDRVKSINVHPVTGQLAWTQAGEEHWWTGKVRMKNPDNTLEIPDYRIYKVRWLK